MAKAPLVALDEKKKALEEKDDKGIRRRVTRSKLRKTQAKLHTLEAKSLENIEQAVNGKTVDKQVVETSKWVVSQLQSIAKSAAADEAELNGLRFKAIELEQREGEVEDKEPEAEQEEQKAKPRFSLVQLPSKDDL